MKRSNLPGPWIGRPILIFSALISLMAAGCASHDSSLSLISNDNRHDFTQHFNHTYISKDDDGDTDVVAEWDGFVPHESDPYRPISPVPTATPRQIVHIRIFWTPLSGMRADHPANTNASLHWYILGDASDHPGMIEYSGSGVVFIDTHSHAATLDIAKAWMKVVAQQGEMLDPLGPSTLSGSMYALDDPEQAADLLSEIKALSTANQDAKNPSDANQPARMTIDP